MMQTVTMNNWCVWVTMVDTGRTARPQHDLPAPLNADATRGRMMPPKFILVSRSVA